ncbi:MAG: hypoxanthine phosphoribosyltransferase [Bacteroidetes bacterium]|nr:hypoxanthine phosphoribosyltransferase [Bacteroidota bacterium]
MNNPREIKVHDKDFELLLSEAEIAERIEQMANQISVDYANKELHIIGVLTGAFMFYAELVKRITINVRVSFIKTSSYQGLKSTGNVHFDLAFPAKLTGEHVLIVDDILDTGRSYKKIYNEIRVQNPASVKLATLLYKPSANTTTYKPNYLGFEIEDKFVVGFGLDYNHLGRNYSSIYQLKK